MAGDKKKRSRNRGARLLKLAAETDGQGLADALMQAAGKQLRRAYVKAQKANSFKPLATLKDAMQILGVATENKVAVTEGVTARIIRDNRVSDKLWDVVMERAAKIGTLTGKPGPKEMTYILKKDDAAEYLTAVQEIQGMKVERK